jgi:hypothetical protein
VYWGLTGGYYGPFDYSFTDNFDYTTLTDVLLSDNYDPPPSGLRGLTRIQNNILAGFVGNTVYFSEPNRPHAWPIAYSISFPFNIVGIAAIAGSALVLTDGYPYILSGSDPSRFGTVRVDALYPCLNSRSIVPMGYGIVWSTHDGLAVFSPGTNAQILTRVLYNQDTWDIAIDPTTVIAEYYGENYFAAHSTGGFIFEQDQRSGGFFTTVDQTFTASWYDSKAGRLFFCTGTSGDVIEWDNLAQPNQTQTWKSKVLKSKEMINLGAARVIADYGTTTFLWNEGPAVTVPGSWESTTTLWNATDEITFTLWADKQEVFTTTLNDMQVFRLPTGYRTDTYEVEVESNVRVRAIHLAETSLGLKDV